MFQAPGPAARYSNGSRLQAPAFSLPLNLPPSNNENNKGCMCGCRLPPTPWNPHSILDSSLVCVCVCVCVWAPCLPLDWPLFHNEKQ